MGDLITQEQIALYQAQTGKTIKTKKKKNDNAAMIQVMLQFSHVSLAERFVEEHSGIIRYVSDWKKWMIWNGHIWQEDRTRFIFALIQQMCKRIAEDETLYFPKVAKSVCSVANMTAIETLASCNPRVVTLSHEWDADEFKINTPAGLLDLASGSLLPLNSQFYHTKCTAVAPEGECPTWEAFIDQITGNRKELAAYLQRMAGYCLTGSTREQTLFFKYGGGANGKSVFVNTMQGILATYAAVAPMGMFAATTHERHPTDLAMLQGARLVVAQETEANQKWSEARIKEITGGTEITARFMKCDFFTYRPKFKLMIAGNHKPTLNNVDEAIQRRLALIPYDVTIPVGQRDPHLADKLKEEWPGIFKWMIEGYKQYQQERLNPPEAVKYRTMEYMIEEDAVQRFLDEMYERDPNSRELLKDLFPAFSNWCIANSEAHGNQKTLASKLVAKGYQKISHPVSRTACFVGLKRRVIPSLIAQ